MVAYVDIYDDWKNPKTLTDWVRNFRLKKVQMRRKLRGAGNDLRVTAILSTALLSAEQELRRKQQERFSRWLEMQSKFVPNYRNRQITNYYEDMMEPEKIEAEAVEYQKQREVANNLWKSELSELDEFMRSLSSNNQTAIAVTS